MGSILNYKLKSIAENIEKLIPASITTVDQFLNKYSVSNLTFFNFKDFFLKFLDYLKKVKNRKESDMVLCWYIYERLVDAINQYGDNPHKIKAFIKQTTGFSEEDPTRDFISKPFNNEQENILEQTTDENIKKILTRDISPDRFIRSPIDQSLISETDYYKIRKEQYLKDYNINSSSDMPILHEIIMSEIQLARYDDFLTSNPEKYTDELRTKIFENLCKAQKTLGISREQRIDFEGTSNDTLADLVKEYEDIRTVVPEIEVLFFLEELEILLQKYDRGELRGTKELSDALFKQITSIDVEQARKIYDENKHLIAEIENKLKDISL